MQRMNVLQLFFLCIFCLYASAQKCDLANAKTGRPFPDLEAESYLSYQMSVEYTVPGDARTDYLMEYYDILNRRGRVEIHKAGKRSTYIYRTETQEAFTIQGQKCQLKPLNATPEFVKGTSDKWVYYPENVKMVKYGPSAMFQYALDAWNKSDKNLGFMGESPNLIRGLKADYWRLCDAESENSWTDYYFTKTNHEDAFGFSKLTRAPLRVTFNGLTADKKPLVQEYDIFSFQPFVSANIYIFELPEFADCSRGPLVEPPELPDFTLGNMFFFGEVVYTATLNNDEGRTYLNNIFFVLDSDSMHVAYYYTNWNVSKREIEINEDLMVEDSKFIVYDMQHKYAYLTDIDTQQCTIIREDGYNPRYKLPENGGYIDLNDPTILFTRNELTFIKESKERGLDANVFQGVFENYAIGDRIIPKAIITHFYYQNGEALTENVAVDNALYLIELKLIDEKKNLIEVVAFNIYGFSNQIRDKRQIFDIQRCYKNENDYIWVTIGFIADKSRIAKIDTDSPEIEADILGSITSSSELNAARIPIITVDVQEDQLFVTMKILGKPPLFLDFMPGEEDKTITGTKEVQGILNFDDCANKCLEVENNCWGFSICGNTCWFGVENGGTVTDKKNCTVYRRFDNSTYVQSKELTVRGIKTLVEKQGFSLMLKDIDDNEVSLRAYSIQITNPGEDDELFSRLGNELNPRMRVLKTGAKLKSTGEAVKNFGKLRYDECQRMCLDFKTCETVSFCLKNSQCILSDKYGDDIDPKNIEVDYGCNLLTRSYVDLFQQSAGIVLTTTARKTLDKSEDEDCARACLKETEFQCLSFDLCSSEEKGSCLLHTVHFIDSKTRESNQIRKSDCSHYYRKYSTEFKKKPETRLVGKLLPPLRDITLEECSSSCMEYGKGTCYGFDFCQEKNLYATSCYLIDKDPQQFKSTYSPICSNYLRDSDALAAPKIYSNSYAGGIGFLCFLIGGIIGFVVVFVIAYIRMNRSR